MKLSKQTPLKASPDDLTPFCTLSPLPDSGVWNLSTPYHNRCSDSLAARDSTIVPKLRHLADRSHQWLVIVSLAVPVKEVVDMTPSPSREYNLTLQMTTGAEPDFPI